MKVIELEGTHAAADLREHVMTAAGSAPELTKRLTATQDGWEPGELDPVRQVRDAGSRPLREAAAELMAERLDRSLPLWCLDVVDLRGERTALLWRIHHAVADGTGVMRLADSVLFGRMGGGDQVGRSREPGKGSKSALARELRPGHRLPQLAQPISRERHVAFARTPLVRLKQAGGTVNDMVLSSVAGAIRRWLEHRHGRVRNVRVKVPVSMHRPGEDAHGTGNADSFMLLDLPVSETDPDARVEAIAAETRARKDAHDADAIGVLMHGRASRIAQRVAGGPHEFALEVSNVPGPREPRDVMGAPVDSLFSLAEVGHRHALRVTVVSLCGEVFFGLTGDAKALPDLDVLAEGLRAELG